MDKKYEEVKQILAKYNQEQLLIWYDKLIEQKREDLLNQILKIDFEQIKTLYEETQHKKDFKDCKIEPLSYIDKQKMSNEEFVAIIERKKELLQEAISQWVDR